MNEIFKPRPEPFLAPHGRGGGSNGKLPQQPVRLTKRQRKEQARAARTQDEQDERIRQGRIRALQWAGGAVLTAVALGAAAQSAPGRALIEAVTGEVDPTKDITLSQLLEQVQNPTPIVQREIDRLGIQKDEKEVQRWKDFPFKRLAQRVTLNEILEDPAKKEQVQQVHNKTVETMQDSANPIFKPAGDNIDALNTSSDLLYFYDPTLTQADTLDGTSASPFGATPMLDAGQNKFYWALSINPFGLYNNADGPLLACGLAHEDEHVKNGNAAVKVYSSPQEKYTRSVQRRQTMSELIAEEARGYAVGAQAYIYHAGLTDELLLPTANDTLRVSMREDAAAFVLTGRNPQNPTWKQYIEWKIKPQ